MNKGIVVILVGVFAIAGCGNTGDDTKPTIEQKEHEEEVFWDYTKPRVVLDPIEEEDSPLLRDLPEKRK